MTGVLTSAWDEITGEAPDPQANLEARRQELLRRLERVTHRIDYLDLLADCFQDTTRGEELLDFWKDHVLQSPPLGPEANGDQRAFQDGGRAFVGGIIRDVERAQDGEIDKVRAIRDDINKQLGAL